MERYLSFCADADDRDALLQQFASLSIAKKRGESSGTDTSTASAGTGVAVSTSASSSSATLTFPPPTLPPTTNTDLSTVLMALRKLREGLLASKRIDDFAVQVYIFNARTAILAKDPESYHPALLHLLRRIHPKHPLTSFELREFAGYLILDVACRQSNLAEAYVLRSRYQLRDPKVDAILHALIHDDYNAFRRICETVDGHKGKFLEFCADEIRKHTLKCFGRAYHSVDVAFLEKATGVTFLELAEKHGVGWHSDGTRVVIRNVKGRS